MNQNNKQNEMSKIIKENPEQVKRSLAIQLAQISKQLKIESEDMRLSKHEHDKLSSVIQAFDQTVRDFMEAGDYVESALKQKVQEVQLELSNLKKEKKTR